MCKIGGKIGRKILRPIFSVANNLQHAFIRPKNRSEMAFATDLEVFATEKLVAIGQFSSSLISHILNIACHKIRFLANKILEAIANSMGLVDNLSNSQATRNKQISNGIKTEK